MNLIIVSVAEGILWGVMALGLFISFRILNIADLTMEGTFPLGASVAAVLITNGLNLYYATLIALLSGMIGGLITGLLITKGGIQPLLAGILTMTGLYSINLRVMGRSNISLLNQPRVTSLTGMNDYYSSIIIGMILLIFFIVILYVFFLSDYGQALIATGDNERMAISLGIRTHQMKITGLMLSNGLVALSGALIAQHSGYADISMGIGTIVIALASVMIAEVTMSNIAFLPRLISLPLGAIIYRLIISGALSLGLNPNDLKFISAILLAIIMILPSMWHKYGIQLSTYRQEEQR